MKGFPERATADRLSLARRWVAGGGVVAAVVALGAAGGYSWSAFPITFLWAGAVTVVGGVVGFLFGIPKAGRRVGVGASGDPAPTGVRANTNLEEVSDWVTKILIGVTLVQYSQFAAGFREAAGLFAAAVHEKRAGAGAASQADIGFASAVLVAFAVGGWLFGYLLTLFSTPVLGRAMTSVERLTEEVKQLSSKVDQVSAEVARAELGRATNPPGHQPRSPHAADRRDTHRTTG